MSNPSPNFVLAGDGDEEVLTVLARFLHPVRGRPELPPVLLHVLHDPIQEIVEELVSVLVLRGTEDLVELLELVDERLGRHGALVGRVPAYV